MAHTSQAYETREQAIADLDASTSARMRAARALLDAPEIANNVHAQHGGGVIVTVQDIPRPDGGVAMQCVVQQLAAPEPALPAVDVHATAASGTASSGDADV